MIIQNKSINLSFYVKIEFQDTNYRVASGILTAQYNGTTAPWLVEV